MSAAVIAACAEHYGILVDELLGKSRARRAVLPRHAAMYVLRKRDGVSYPSIAGLLDLKDHTSVLHGVRTAERRRASDKHLDAILVALMALPKHSETIVRLKAQPETQLDLVPPPPKPAQTPNRRFKTMPQRYCKPVNELAPDDHDAFAREKGTDALLAAMRREGMVAL